MGLRNMRAICPNCGGKIHTQARGLGHLTWANSWFLAKTGSECQWCGAALTGRVKADGRAELASEPKPTPPASTRRTPAAPREGWWPDPAGRYTRRYFDGVRWTWRVSQDDGEVVVDPQGALR